MEDYEERKRPERELLLPQDAYEVDPRQLNHVPDDQANLHTDPNILAQANLNLGNHPNAVAGNQPPGNQPPDNQLPDNQFPNHIVVQVEEDPLRPFILKEYLGPYIAPEKFDIYLLGLKPAIDFRIFELEEIFESGSYKIYMIYLLVVCLFSFGPAVLFFIAMSTRLALAGLAVVILAHIGCAMKQLYDEYDAMTKTNLTLANNAIFWMMIYTIITFTVILSLGFIPPLQDQDTTPILVIYIVLLVLHFITLYGAFKVKKALDEKNKLQGFSDGLVALSDRPAYERYLTLFKILRLLSEKGSIFPIRNKHRPQKKEDHTAEYAEVMNHFAEALRTFAEHMPKAGS